jgi:hypothetical protein
MKAIGRNEPCPCGSGKKYKKCCIDKDLAGTQTQSAAERYGDSTDDRIPEPGKGATQSPQIFDALLRFGQRDRFAEAYAEAYEMFWSLDFSAPSEEALNEVCQREEAANLFVPWFLFDFPLADGRTLAEQFLEAEGGRFEPGEREYLRAMCATEYRLYEVQDVRRDEGLTLKDLLTGEEVWVRERLATHGLIRWDLLATRVRRGPEKEARLEPGIFQYPVDAKGELVGALQAMYDGYLERAGKGATQKEFLTFTAPFFAAEWLHRTVFPPPPVLQNTDGDPLLMVTQRFRITERDLFLEALRDHPDMEEEEVGEDFLWIREQPDGQRIHRAHLHIEGDTLIAETNSRKRANTLKKLLKRIAGSTLKHIETSAKTMDELMAEREDRGGEEGDSDVEDPSGIPQEVQEAVIRDYLDRHMHAWVDMPLPALKGLTPRKAALLPRRRGAVVNLLKSLENCEARRAAAAGGAPYDFGWLWKELGLDSERR